MNGLMGMGVLGWCVSLVVGFVVGGIFFLSIKAQVNYVLTRGSPGWLVPALLYARMILMGAVLVVIALTVPRGKLAGALLAGVAGTFVARILVSRMVRHGGDASPPTVGEEAPVEPVEE